MLQYGWYYLVLVINNVYLVLFCLGDKQVDCGILQQSKKVTRIFSFNLVDITKIFHIGSVSLKSILVNDPLSLFYYCDYVSSANSTVN